MNTSCEKIGKPELLSWGFWATIGLSFIVFLFYFLAQLAVVVVFAVVARIRHPGIDIRSLKSDGLLLVITTIVGGLALIGFSFLFAKFNKKITIKEYFCFYKSDKKQFYTWFLSILLLAVCSDGLSVILNKPIVPKFLVTAYSTIRFKPLLWFALSIASPLSEEIFFRGFLFKGIQNSRIGSIGAILLSSLCWSTLHIQYDFYGIATVFVGGLLLGIARVKSNSIYVSIMMHAVWSSISIIQVAAYVKIVLN